MQTNPLATGHWHTQLCREGHAKKLQHQAAINSAHAVEQDFSAYGEMLEKVEVFKHLGRLLACNNNDIQAVRSNLRKARKCWGRILKVLRTENASYRVCGLFYKATMQAVLLFGSETWCMSTLALKSLEGFHLRAVYRMVQVNKPLQGPN